MGPRAWHGWALLAVAAVAQGDDRFYTIMGPDGRPQVIRGEAPAGPAPAAVAPAAPGASGPAAPVTVAPAKATTPPAARVLAPYDSDDYTDVEDVDGMLREQRSRKRFYVLPDGGMGSQVHESAEASADTPPPSSANPAPREDSFSTLAGSPREQTGEAAQAAWPGLRDCVAPKALASLPGLDVDAPRAVVLNERAYQFPGPGGMLGGVEVAGEGMRTLVVRSYSRTGRNPAYVEPALAFLDGQGCLRRWVDGYASRLYPGSDVRHASIRGEVAVQGEERYVLLMAAPADAAGRPFQASRYGQIKLILKK